MYCKNCGEQIPEDANNCPGCGGPAKVSASDPGAARVAMPQGTPPPTFLVPSILVTLFCCQIFGIVAIVYSAIAMGKNSSGDYAEAQRFAGNAKMWCWIGFGTGIVVIGGYILLMVLGLAAGAAGSTP